MENKYVVGGIIILLFVIMGLLIYGIKLFKMKRKFTLNEDGSIDIQKFLNTFYEEIQRDEKNVEEKIEKFVESLNQHTAGSKMLLSNVDSRTQELIAYVEDDSKKTKEDILNTLEGLKGALGNVLSSMQKDIESMKNEVSGLRQITLEKENKIKRYEEGYDQKNIKNFRKELFSIIHFIDKNKTDENSDVLIEVHQDLELLLENVGIEKINIEIGKKYGGQEKLAKVQETIETNDIEKDGLIAELVKDGYFIQTTEDSQKVLQPAEIKIYKYKNNQKASIPDDESSEVNELGVDVEDQQSSDKNNTKGKENE